MKHRWSGYLAMFVTSFIVILKSTRITCWLCEWSPVSRTYWHWPAYLIQSAQIANSTAHVLSQQWYGTPCFSPLLWQTNSKINIFHFLDDDMSLVCLGADFWTMDSCKTMTSGWHIDCEQEAMLSNPFNNIRMMRRLFLDFLFFFLNFAWIVMILNERQN